MADGGLASPTMITSLGRRLPLLLGLMALCVAACSSGSTRATVLTRPSSSLSPRATEASPSPTPSPASTAAVEAGLRAWIAAANKAFATGDTTDLVASSEKSCGCLKLAKTVEGYWSAGGIRGLTWTLHRLLRIDITYHIATVQFDFDEASYHVIAHGRASSTHVADRITVFSQFALHDGVWRMWNYTQVKAGKL